MTKLMYQPNREGRKGPRRWTLKDNQGFTLVPGLNEVDDDLLALAEDEPSFSDLVERRAIVYMEEKEPAEKTSTDYKVDELEGVLPGIDDVEKLQAWLESETRTTAKTAITDRIEELTDAA